MEHTTQGDLLTTEDLVELVVANGIRTREQLVNLAAAWHNANRFRSDLLDMTRQLRFDMMMRGELRLSTGTERNMPPGFLTQVEHAGSAEHEPGG